MSLVSITAGFLPLFDSLLLVVAKEMGFAESEGLSLSLTRETSWANIRDRAALGHFDIALMLAPMPIAASLGLTPLATPMIAPVMAGLGNNAITVSSELWRQMVAAGAPVDMSPAATGAALAATVRANARRLRFAVVHQTSSHNYELRYWLAANGIMPDRDLEIVVLPPPLLPEALKSGGIDGYCVGEPWNSVGVETAGGHIATAKALIWQNSPDKLIGMRADWAERNPEIVQGLVRAIYRAGEWAGRPENQMAASEIMSRQTYLDLPAGLVERALAGRLATGHGVMTVPDFFVPHASAANFPWQSHALWYYSQMVRWGELPGSQAQAEIARSCFRPDIYRAALESLGIDAPAVDMKRDGVHAEPYEMAGRMGPIGMGPNAFFDGAVFDPDQIDAYITEQTQTD
jgi:NitT/TauT family transport system ATP-binding protein